jgi:V/A-type H+-transporting ATPase subunit E
MAGMEKIGEAILDKVRAEASGIIKEAEQKAAEEVERAKREQAARLEEGKAKLLQEARAEATRIEAQALVRARQELTQAKDEVISEVVSRVKSELAKVASDPGSLAALIKEAVATLGLNQGRLYVSPRDLAAVKKLIAGDKELAGRVVEIKEHRLSGGVIVEDVEGRVRIDNTYETRLEMLLPRLLPEVARELFQD